MAIVKKCEQCSKKYKCYPCEVKTGRKYCSKECKGMASRGKMPWNYAKVAITCILCGKEKLLPSSAAQSQRYCSRKCKSKAQEHKITVKCKQCGITFRKKPSEKRFLCSTKCRGVWQEDSRSCTCKFCGGIFKEIPSRIDDGKGRYCSKKCQYKDKKGCRMAWLPTFQKGNVPWNKGIVWSDMRGEGHPLWKGGATSLVRRLRTCSKYKEWRKKVYERDNYTCQECGRSPSGKLNADHIYPFWAIIDRHKPTSLEQAEACLQLWDISNGRTLCIDCHKKTPTYGKGAWKYVEVVQ